MSPSQVLSTVKNAESPTQDYTYTGVTVGAEEKLKIEGTKFFVRYQFDEETGSLSQVLIGPEGEENRNAFNKLNRYFQEQYGPPDEKREAIGIPKTSWIWKFPTTIVRTQFFDYAGGIVAANAFPTPEERLERIEALREKEHSVVLRGQTFEKNSANGITLGIEVENISDSKTVKYLTIHWKLFNPVGDPADVEQGAGSAEAQTKLVGPLKPMEGSYTEFKNVWHSKVGGCAEIREIKVEHIDGSTYKSRNLQTAVDTTFQGLGTGPFIRGDCSYEAQQKRKE